MAGIRRAGIGVWPNGERLPLGGGLPRGGGFCEGGRREAYGERLTPHPDRKVAFAPWPASFTGGGS